MNKQPYRQIIIRMDSENLCALHARIVRKDATKSKSQAETQQPPQDDKWRRKCGCIRTSEKLKEVLKTFPAAPPPSPLYEQDCITAFTADQPPFPIVRANAPEYMYTDRDVGGIESKLGSKSWQIVADLVHLVQLSVTATALALYYVIYCYMQLIYYTLRSALYFHNADGPMKITIGVVTITSVIVGFNLIIRMEKLIGIYLF